jgi:uncharacterized phage protein (TIGR02218 family)
MKVISDALTTHIGQDATTLATCWRIQRLDGTVFTFTDHDRDLVVSGETYSAETGFTRSAVDGDITLAAPNLQVVGFVDAINQSDLQNGLWDYAAINIFLVNWQSPSDGIIKLRKGWIGEVTLDDSGEFRAELRGLAQVLGNNVGELFTPECRAQLFDSRCKVNITSYTFTGVAGSGSTRYVFQNTTLSQSAGYFDGGVITMTSGANNGVKREILTWSSSILTLFLPMPHDIASGDTFSIVPGCDKRSTTCFNKFNNIANFRGEPFVPGADALLDFPVPGSTPPA